MTQISGDLQLRFKSTALSCTSLFLDKNIECRSSKFWTSWSLWWKIDKLRRTWTSSWRNLWLQRGAAAAAAAAEIRARALRKSDLRKIARARSGLRWNRNRIVANPFEWKSVPKPFNGIGPQTMAAMVDDRSSGFKWAHRSRRKLKTGPAFTRWRLQ